MPYRLAITIAGAVSLGSFEAGVLFEVLDALGQHNRAAPPDQHVYIDVLTGASAGGMTAAITAQTLLYGAATIAGPYDNPFYNPWVASVDINGLLPLDNQESAAKSVLSSDFVRAMAEKFLMARYAGAQVPPATTHPALNPARRIRLGLALSNLQGVDFLRPILNGGTFNYTRFRDQITFSLHSKTDIRLAWEPVRDAALACGAFPFAFRPQDLSRKESDFPSDFLAPWPQPTRTFTYTDGGVFQNQPLGLAKNLVDLEDQHQDSDRRGYLFVSPRPVDPTLSSITADSATFEVMTRALVNAIYNQAGYRDWIEAESVNEAVNLLNQRASQLAALFKTGTVQPAAIQGVTTALLEQFRLSPAELEAARKQLRTQFADDYAVLSAMVPPTADAWIDAILLLELAADLHEKDEMYIYELTAETKDLAGAGLFSFFGFLYRTFREHDYDLGRQKAQAFLTSANRSSKGKLPRLNYRPQPIRPIQPTPSSGFTATMIPENNRKAIYKALAAAVDNFLTLEGLPWIIRKLVMQCYINRKIENVLGL